MATCMMSYMQGQDLKEIVSTQQYLRVKTHNQSKTLIDQSCISGRLKVTK